MSMADDCDERLYLDDLGRELRGLRRLQGLSIDGLAERTGLHRNTISGAERGVNDLRLVSNARIMAALGCDGFAIGESCFAFDVAEPGDRPTDGEVLRLPPSAIVYMTGRTIRQRRLAVGMTMASLSEATGIHSNTIWNIERGLVEASLFNLYKIHRGLGVSSMRATASGLRILA